MKFKLLMTILLFSALNSSVKTWADNVPTSAPLTPQEVAAIESVEITRSDVSQLSFKNGVTYTLDGPTTDEQKNFISALSEGERTAFYQKRVQMITPMAKMFAFFGKRAQKFFQKKITAVNNEFFKHASVIAKSTEFGLNVSGGVMGGVGVYKYGVFLTSNIGASVGYDYERKTTVIDIFLDLESLEKALPVVAEVAINSNVMAYASNEHRELVQKGRYFSPPVLPVASDDFPSAINVGYSMGFGFPPLDWLYAYSGNKTRFSLLKLKIPTTTHGWNYKDIQSETAVVLALANINSGLKLALNTVVKKPCAWALAKYQNRHEAGLISLDLDK